MQKKNLGNFEVDLSISESEIEIIDEISKNIDTSTLVVFWQFILKTLEELSIVTNPILALEMLIIRLIHLKDLPSYEGVLNLIEKNDHKQTSGDVVVEKKTTNLQKETNEISKDQIKNTIQTKPVLTSLSEKNFSRNDEIENISSFEDLIKLSSKKREVELKYDLERNVNLINFSTGKINIGFNEKLGKDFVRNLSEKLKIWTGKRWVITLTKAKGQKTFVEQAAERKNIFLEKERKGEVYKKIKYIFSDAELIDVSKKD